MKNAAVRRETAPTNTNVMINAGCAHRFNQRPVRLTVIAPAANIKIINPKNFLDLLVIYIF